MVWPGLDFIVGAVVFPVFVALDVVLFVVPGIPLLVAPVFWTVHVAVEDRSFVDGIQESWARTREHRMRLLLLGLAVAIVGIVVSAVFGVVAVPGGTAGPRLAQVGSAPMTVFSLATVAAAYDQFVALPSEGPTVTTDTERSTAAEVARDTRLLGTQELFDTELTNVVTGAERARLPRSDRWGCAPPNGSPSRSAVWFRSASDAPTRAPWSRTGGHADPCPESPSPVHPQQGWSRGILAIRSDIRILPSVSCCRQ
jgi:hypothetical protein